MPKADAKKTIITIDPSMEWDRKLNYLEKQSGLEIFRAIYWGIFLFVIGIMLVIASQGSTNLATLGGWLVITLAFFVIIYGFVLSLHYKFLKKHA